MALREAEVQPPNTAATRSAISSLRALSAKVTSSEAPSSTTGTTRRPSTPPAAFSSPIASSTASRTVTSLIAMVPESECSIPTLTASPVTPGPGGAQPPASTAPAPASAAPRNVRLRTGRLPLSCSGSVTGRCFPGRAHRLHRGFPGPGGGARAGSAADDEGAGGLVVHGLPAVVPERPEQVDQQADVGEGQGHQDQFADERAADRGRLAGLLDDEPAPAHPLAEGPAGAGVTADPVHHAEAHPAQQAEDRADPYQRGRALLVPGRVDQVGEPEEDADDRAARGEPAEGDHQPVDEVGAGP